MELPTHPESEDSTPDQRPAATTGSRATVVVFVIIGVLIAVMLILHLVGIVGPGAP